MGYQGKHVTKYSVCMEIQCQMISVKFKFSNNCELKTNNTENLQCTFVAVQESVRLFFWFHTFFC